MNNQKKSKKNKGLRFVILVIIFAMLGSGFLSVLFTLINFI